MLADSWSDPWAGQPALHLASEPNSPPAVPTAPAPPAPASLLLLKPLQGSTEAAPSPLPQEPWMCLRAHLPSW